QVLDDDARQSFAEDCAVRMLRDDVLVLDTETVRALAVKSVGAHRAPIDDVLTDLRTCSFMTTDPDGGWRFIHRSFQEFFVARRIAATLSTTGPSLLRAELTLE